MATQQTQRSTLAIGIVIVQIFVGLLQASAFYLLRAYSETALSIEKRLDELEKFAAKGDRFTSLDAARFRAEILALDSQMEKRITLIEKDLDHLWLTHHPKERTSTHSDENFASFEIDQ